MKFHFDPSAGLVVVRARLVGPAVDMLTDLELDTGATTSVISWSSAVALGYDPAAVPERVPVTTGSGIEYCPLLELQQFEALGRVVESLEVLCHDLPARSRVRGLIGINFLRSFDVRINFKQGFISLG